MCFKQIAVLTIPFSLFAGAVVLPINADEIRTESLASRISIVDPDGDCEFRFGGDRLTITVPPTNHNLHPIRGMNAPRVLKQISGDFTVQVKVSSDFAPGKKSTKPQGQGRPFNGAGILIWENGENYLRIERNAYWLGDSLYCYPPLIEYWRDREDSGVNNPPRDASYFTGRSTWLKARRHGDRMTVSISHDGEEWSEVKTFPVDMADEVHVGVAAVNSSDEPFAVDFEEFAVATAGLGALQAQSDEPASQETTLTFDAPRIEQELVNTLAKAFDQAVGMYKADQKAEPNAAIRLNDKLYEAQLQAAEENRLIAESYVNRAKQVEDIANHKLENGLGTSTAWLEAKASRLKATRELAKWQR